MILSNQDEGWVLSKIALYAGILKCYTATE